MKTAHRAFLCVLLLSGCARLDAQDSKIGNTETPSRIERALVYQDRVLITRRTGPISLKRGCQEIFFSNLPVSLRDESVRAEVIGGSGIRVIDVEVKLYHLEKVAEKKLQQLKERLLRSQDEETVIQNRIRLIRFRRNYLHGVKKHFLSRGSGEKRNSAGGRMGPKEYNAMLAYLLQGLGETLNALRLEKKKLRTVHEKIRFLSVQLHQARIARRASAKRKLVKVNLDAKSRETVRVEISYINFNVSWKPRYDIRVFRNRKETHFSGYGIVSQNSGEDWKNVALSFSTALPAVQARVPEIKPVYAVLTSGRGGANIASQEENRSSKKSFTKKSGSQIFNAAKKTNIPADGSPHRTTISRHVFPVTFEYLSIPRLTDHVYLRALGKNVMPHPILSGDLHIFMGNDFMGSAYTENILPGEDFELTLNANEKIRVTRKLEESASESGGLFSSSRIFTYSYSIKAENYSGESITLNIIDQKPISKSEKLKIKPAKYSIQPVLETKKGVVKWRLRMSPGEKKTITYSFKIEVPKKSAPAFYRKAKRGQIRRSLNQLDDLEKNESIRRRQKRRAPSMKKFLY